MRSTIFESFEKWVVEFSVSQQLNVDSAFPPSVREWHPFEGPLAVSVAFLAPSAWRFVLFCFG